jgi:hypothetical protein
MTTDTATFASVMHVRQVDETRRAAQLDKLKAQAQDASVFDEEDPPYIFDLVASTNAVDTYGTQMMPSTLRNYSKDGAAGVSLLYGHVKRDIPHGRTFDGSYHDARHPIGPHVRLSAFMARNVTLNGRDNNDLIRLVRMGQLADTSISFYGERIVCSLDGKPMLDLFDVLSGGSSKDDCVHIPGMQYDWQGERKTAIGQVEDAHLSEVSLVFDGSTPGAAVVKATRMVEASRLDRHTIEQVEKRFRTHIRGATRVFASATPQTRSVGPHIVTIRPPDETLDYAPSLPPLDAAYLHGS